MVDCLVLAGGPGGELAQMEGVSSKSLVKLGEKDLLYYVLKAIRGVKEIRRIALVGPSAELDHLAAEFSAEIVPGVSGDSSIAQNVLTGTRYLVPSHPLLVSSADIPLVTPEAVSDFLKKCSPYEDDLYYPIVRRENIENRFPGADRTYASFREGSFTGGNVFLLNPHKIEDHVPVVEKFVEARKNPLKMASLLGTGLILSFMSGTLTLPKLEKSISKIFKIKARAVISEYSEISFDIDKPADLELARRVMQVQ